MKGFYGQKLPGTCFANEWGAHPFDSISCHILIHTTQRTSPVDEQASFVGNTVLPQSNTHGFKGFGYNTTNDETTAPLVLPGYFAPSEVATWSPRTITTFGYPTTYEGPAFINSQCVIGLERKFANVEFTNRKVVYFDDAEASKRYNYNGDFLGSDWLGFLHPGGWMYYPWGMASPMVAESYFEDAGTYSSASPFDETEYNFLKFATPLNVYTAPDGLTLKGQYTGLKFIVFFGECAVKRPIAPLPDDPYSTAIPPPAMNPSKQLVGCQVWIYLAAQPAVGQTLLSPRIGSWRGWMYDTGSTGGFTVAVNTSWMDKYMYLTFSTPDTHVNSFSPSVTFNLTSGVAATKRVVLSNMKLYIVA